MNDVRFRHFRLTRDGEFVDYTKDLKTQEISNLGGLTVAYKEVEPDVIRFAYAICSGQDNFCKKTGRTIAAGRLNSDKIAKTLHVKYEDFLSQLQEMFI
jgi:hypothetical protein